MKSFIVLLLLLAATAVRVTAQDQHYFDSLHAAYAYASEDTDKSDILLKLATALEDADTATALSYAVQSRDYAVKAHDGRRTARYDLFVARLYSNSGLYDSARARLNYALKAAQSLKDSDLLTRAYNQLGWNDLEIGSYDEALDYFLTALDVSQHRRDTAGISDVYNNIGCLYLDQQEPENALKYLHLALANVSRSHDLRMTAAIENNIGLSFNGPIASVSFDARQDSALYYFRSSADRYALAGERYERARVLGNIGSVFEKKGVLDSTLYYYRASVYMHQEVGLNSTYTAGAYALLGNLFLRLHRNDSAFYYLDLAKSIDERIGARRGLVDQYLSLAKAYASTGNYKLAFEFLDKGSTLHDSLYNLDKSRILADMDAKYQSSKNERKIAAQNEEIAEQRLVNYSIIGVAVVLCLIALLLYRGERKLQHINVQLAAAKERAEASERLEHQFLANMSHEIRTPMNAVLGMTTLLLDTPLTEKQREYLEAIQASADNLLVVINDILDLSKLQAGKMEFEHIPFRLHDVIEHAMDMIRFKAEAKGIPLNENVSESVPRVVIGDPARLSQIVMNLLSNAIKLTEHGSVTVLMSAAIAGDRMMLVRIAVQDTGIGIPLEKQKTVFDSFSQAETETSRKYGGTGLGLTISRTLVELQGGTLELISEPGKGSEFSFLIPYEVASEEVLVEPERTTHLDAASLRGLKVLLVEDNEYNQIVLTDTLHNMIPEVAIEIASNGLEAITLMQRFSFDLVLMDVQMPEMDGIEATKHIRNHLPRGRRETPIVALTASVIKSEIDRCLAAGMNDYVPKPFKQDELFRVIGKYYKGKPKTVVEPTIAEIVSPEPLLPNDRSHTASTNGMISEPVTNLSALQEITGGNQEQLKKYIKMFLDGIPGHLQSVASALDANDFDGARRRVHAMKPQLKFMGMATAAGFAESIEQLCAGTPNPAEVHEKFGQVKAQCEQAFEELKVKL